MAIPPKRLRKFDTKIQYLKYKILREVARHAFEDRLLECGDNLRKLLIQKKPTMRCCIYKEQAILHEQVKIAMGGDKENPNIIEVVDIACDECPRGGYEVTDSCRSCLAHRCEDVCPRGAISFDEHQRAHIDKDKCVQCGRCATVCPYSAIVNNKRPCEVSCKVGAITADPETGAARIDNDKCISCGACVYKCPFGAISDKSYILDVVKILKDSQENQEYKVYAVVAPSIASQFSYAKLGQVITGIKALGFHHVVEAALGADMVAQLESKELLEKGFLTSSCCPAFVDYIEKFFPTMKEHVSHNLSPMAKISEYIKFTDPNCKIVFIGPCTAKKMELQQERVANVMEAVITFEELQALFDSRDLNINTMEEDVLDNASYYGRIFARSGGLTDAVAQAIREQNLDDSAFKPIACDGIEECRAALMRASKNVLPYNFIEGMACVQGCIGGAGCLTHGEKNKNEVDKYGKEAMEKTIQDAVSILDM